MAVYDLEEQDQIDDLRAFWNRWGGAITTGIVLACLVIAGVQGWRWWANQRSEQASALYSAVSDAAHKNDNAKARDAITQLSDKYAGTGYAPRAALLYAKMLYDAGDRAGAKLQLNWVIEHADEEELKAIARYRLAQAMIDDKQYDDALRTLDAKHPDAFDGLYADLRGDALAAAGRPADARAAYETALAKIDPKSQYRVYLQVKLDALGGSAAAPALGSAAPAPGAQAGSAPAKSPPAAAAPAAATPAPAAPPSPSAAAPTPAAAAPAPSDKSKATPLAATPAKGSAAKP
jgi:predicted negative regulator of RcsB-dependent stress response